MAWQHALQSIKAFLEWLAQETQSDRYQEERERVVVGPHPTSDMLYNYVLDELTPEETYIIQKHIAFCGLCAEEVLRIRLIEEELDEGVEESILALLNQAQVLLTDQRYEDAIALYNDVLEQEPTMLETPIGQAFFQTDAFFPITAAHTEKFDLLPYIFPEYTPEKYILTAANPRSIFPLTVEYAHGKVKGTFTTAGRSLVFELVEAQDEFHAGIQLMARILEPTPCLKVWTITHGKPYKLGTIKALVGSLELTETAKNMLQLVRVFPLI